MKISKLILFLSLSFLFAGCFKEEIELDLNQGGNVKMAVEAWITDLDEMQTITLSKTSDYFADFEQTGITDASVEISYDDSTIAFAHSENGVYEAPNNWRAEPNKEYTIKIDYDGQTYSASSFMDEMPDLENVYAEMFDVVNDTALYAILFSFAETPGEGNGYYGVDYRKGDPEWSLTTGGFTNDDYFDGIYIEDASVSFEDYYLGETVVLETFSIGLESSNFLFDIQTEVYREGLFDPPPVNIRSNISNGALGYFIASGAKRVEVVIE